jgi:glutathione S-transferase
MLTLYGNLDSGNVYKVRLLLAQLAIPHQRIDVAQVRGEPRSSAFRAINPIGKVPAVQFENGRILSESGAILYYFARNTRFLPDDCWEAANVLRWMFFEQYSHEPYIAVNRYILRYATEPHRTRLMDRVPENKDKGEHALSVMNEHLCRCAWLAADRYTIADIALYAYTHCAHEGGFDLGSYKGLCQWIERVRAQPRHILQMEETSAVPPRRLADFVKLPASSSGASPRARDASHPAADGRSVGQPSTVPRRSGG